ncbi:MAG: DNA pilot protein [Malazfec virus 3]
MKTNKQPIILIWGMIGGTAVGGIIDGISADRQQEAIDRNRDANQRVERENAQMYYDLSMKKWRETNYKAQMEEMRKAGLNPGLMYGTGGGQGGQSTVATASRGSGENITPQMNATAGMGIGLQAQQTQAQIDLLKAETEKTKTEAKKIGGVDTELTQSTIGKVIADTTNTEAKTKLTNVETNIQKIEEYYRTDKLSEELSKIIAETHKLHSETYISQQSAESIIREAKAKAIGQEVLNELNVSRIRLTEAQEKQVREAVAQKWEEISLYDTEVNIKIAQTILNGIGTVGGLMQAGKLAEAMKESKQKMTQFDKDQEWKKGFEEGVGQWRN